MADRALLKKYANRRLYDTERSTYITLNEVSEMVKSGRQVQVVDAKTNEDVTAFILTQIIVEEARKKNTLLPVPLLHIIIQHGDNVLSEFFEKYLELTIQNYMAYKAAFEEQFKKWLSMGFDLSSMAPKGAPPFQGFGTFLELFSRMPKESEKK